MQYRPFSRLDKPSVDFVGVHDADIYRRLGKVRFKPNFGDDETGHCKRYICRSSG